MKALFVGILLTVFIASCKKEETRTCKKNMKSIAGRYKLSKVELVSYKTGEAQDVTSTLSNCDLSGIYIFNTDNTTTYAEMGNCSGSGSGTWGLSGGNLFTSFENGNGNKISPTSIVSWDCTNLVLITRFPTVEYNNRYTLTKF